MYFDPSHSQLVMIALSLLGVVQTAVAGLILFEVGGSIDRINPDVPREKPALRIAPLADEVL